MKMTLMSSEKYNESKWKNGYGNGGYSDKQKAVLTLRVSAVLVVLVILIIALKLLVVLSQFLFLNWEYEIRISSFSENNISLVISDEKFFLEGYVPMCYYFEIQTSVSGLRKTKLKIVSGKPITLLLNDTGIDMLAKVQLTSNWLSTNCNFLLWPSIKGLSWIIASWTLLYLDSDDPGMNPPSPFSSRKNRYQHQFRNNCHIGYFTSLATGVVIFSLSFIN